MTDEPRDTDDDGNPIPALDPMLTRMEPARAIAIAANWHRWNDAMEEWISPDAPQPPAPLSDAAETYAALIALVRESRFDDARRLAQVIVMRGYDQDDPEDESAERVAFMRWGLTQALIDEVERRES